MPDLTGAQVRVFPDPTTPADEVPASGVHPDHGRLIWWLDQGAASLLY